MKDRRGAAVSALLLGVVGVVSVSLVWVLSFSAVFDDLPFRDALGQVVFFGLLIGTGPAVVVGIVGLRSTRRWMAVLGIVLGVLSIVGMAIAVVHPWTGLASDGGDKTIGVRAGTTDRCVTVAACGQVGRGGVVPMSTSS